MKLKREARPTYLLILGERAGLAWVLENRRMAFTESRVSQASRLAVGDRLFPYTTRGCFHNPTRDRGRVIGEAMVAGNLRKRRRPLVIGGREFTHECEITLESLAPLGEGVELAALVPQLEAFRDVPLWSFKLRQPLVRLPDGDASLIANELAGVAGAVEDALGGYLKLARYVGQRS